MADVPVRLVAGVFDDDGTLRYEGDEFAVSEAAFDEHPELERVEDDDSEASDDDSETSDDAEVCGAPLTSGGTCDRPAASCPYHSDSDDTASEN
jgi:hypothetical protein